MSSANHREFLPAAGHDFFLPLYDPLVRFLGFDRSRQELISQANVKPDHHILDIGCGTGTFVVLLKRQFPAAEVIGLDPDPKALRRAKSKVARAAVSVQLDQGFSDELPYESESFDRVFSSFMFHHLEEQEREKTLKEVLRVLKPGGSFHMLDFTADHGEHGFLDRFFHSHARLRDNTDDGIFQQITRAGFTKAVKLKEDKMMLGLMQTGYYKAQA
ncbi:MAG TPA: class I SAM-dependent methyltransferase [Pyrinomonadaceae bacterium]|nr:class I SAM-dependent methyltransferase [Pyrinomonadaceae bacterium]